MKYQSILDKISNYFKGEGMSEEIIEIQKRSYNLKNLFLDPNNYRFVDNENYKKIDEKDLLDINIQKRTRKFIEGKKRENKKDLIASFKALRISSPGSKIPLSVSTTYPLFPYFT